MELQQRKILYLIFGAGGFFVAIPAILGFFVASIALIFGEFTSIDLFLVTLGGFIGLGGASYSWVNLPVNKFQNRVLATIGISIGCASLVATITYVWVWPPAFFASGILSIAIGSYLYLLPGIVGLMLIFELWLNHNDSKQ